MIVLMNSRLAKFDRFPDNYIHKSLDEVRFDTGLTEKTLKKYIYVSLDIFRKMEHNELTELEAWMYFLASDKPEDIRRVIGAFPEFAELYQEIIRFRYNPRELMTMVPEAIRMMDEGSFQLMIDRLQEQLDTKVGQLAELTKQNEELAGQNEELAGQNEELVGQNEELAGQNEELAGQNEELAGQNEELAGQNEELVGQNEELVGQNKQLAGRQEELAEQNKQLAGQQEELAEQNKALLTRQEELLTENLRQLIEAVENVMKGFQVDCQSACKVLGRTVEEYETAKSQLTGKS